MLFTQNRASNWEADALQVKGSFFGTLVVIKNGFQGRLTACAQRERVAVFYPRSGYAVWSHWRGTGTSSRV